MTRCNNAIWLIALFLMGITAHAQDPHFSQYYANPLYLNPAFAGVKKCPSLHLNYRNQYPALGVYQTYSASYDQYVAGIKGGLGVLLMRDEAGNGALNLTEASVIYSYHLKVNRKFTMLAGFQATFRQRSLNWGSFTFPDQIDPFYGFVKQTNEVQPGANTNNHLDLSVGFLGYTEYWYLGATAHHLTEPNEAFLSNNQLPLKLTVHGGASIPLGRRRLHNSTRNLLIPNFVYQLQGSASQITAGLSFNRGPISGGLSLRHGGNNPDAAIIILGLAPEKQAWSIGYSYDYTISDLTNVPGGSHEISLMYNFPCRVRKQSIKEIKCPTF
jgi:type IX secretion system PorP/SprF family membrane protein